MSYLFINSIESLATLDGEGVRSAVFLQGCPLRCVYCHNPESWQAGGGEKISVENLAERLLRFKSYWGADGGVTISGGEPLMQAAELIDFCKILKKNKVNLALDTSGAVFNSETKELMRMCEHIILDFKFNTALKYKKHANAPDAYAAVFKTLDFLKECAAAGEPKKLWIRIVVVPGINNSIAELDKYLAALKPYSAIISKIELLGFHTLAFSKYEKLGIKNTLADTPALAPEELTKLQNYINKKL